MEPISATASILTVLGAAGGTCKYLYNTLHDLSDAPRDIQVQRQQLERLERTLLALVELYSRLPSDFQLDPLLHVDVVAFANEIQTIRSKVESQTTRLEQGRVRRLQESCKWVFFSRQAKKFFESAEHWHAVLSQVMMASQIALSVRIEHQLSTLIGLPDDIAQNHNVCKQHYPSAISKSVSDSESALPVILGQPSHSAKIIIDSRTPRTIPYISDILDPVDVKHILSSCFSIGFFSVGICVGPAIVLKFVQRGQEISTKTSTSDGYAACLLIQDNHFMKKRLKILISNVFGSRYILNLSFRVLRFTSLLPLDGNFHNAIRNGDGTYLRQGLLTRKISIYDTTTSGDTLLHVAAMCNQRDIITLLVKEGADVNATNDMGETPLHRSVKKGNDYESTRRLLLNGADASRQDHSGRTAFHYYYNEVIDQALRWNTEDIDPYLQDDDGMTIMHWASHTSKSSVQGIINNASGLLDELNHPIGRMSPLNMKDSLGRSLLHFAVGRSNIELAEYLQNQPQFQAMSIPDHSGFTLLHYAVRSRRLELIDFCVKHKSDLHAVDVAGQTALHHAAKCNHLAAVKRLLDLGATSQLKIRDLEGRTPLHIARLTGPTVAEFLKPLCVDDEFDCFNELGQMSRNPWTPSRIIGLVLSTVASVLFLSWLLLTAK